MDYQFLCFALSKEKNSIFNYRRVSWNSFWINKNLFSSVEVSVLCVMNVSLYLHRDYLFMNVCISVFVIGLALALSMCARIFLGHLKKDLTPVGVCAAEINFSQNSVIIKEFSFLLLFCSAGDRKMFKCH